MLLNHSKTVWSFLVLFLKFARNHNSSVSSIANHSLLLKQNASNPSECPIWCSVNQGFPGWLVGRGTIFTLMWILSTVLSSIFWTFFPSIRLLVPYPCFLGTILLHIWKWRFVDFQNSLSTQVSPLWYDVQCSCHFTVLDHPGNLLSPGSSMDLIWIIHPCTTAWKLSWGSKFWQ